MTAQPPLPLRDPARRRRIALIDQRLTVFARHLHQHRTSECPRRCDYLLLITRIDMWLDERLKETA